MKENTKKILKILGITSISLTSLLPGLPLLQENIDLTCIEKIPTNVDIDSGIMDCGKIEMQLQHFDLGSITASGAVVIQTHGIS